MAMKTSPSSKPKPPLRISWHMWGPGALFYLIWLWGDQVVGRK